MAISERKTQGVNPAKSFLVAAAFMVILSPGDQGDKERATIASKTAHPPYWQSHCASTGSNRLARGFGGRSFVPYLSKQ